MSAPKTNIEKQQRRHWAPLLGMGLVALFGVGLIIYWLGEEVADSDPPPQETHETMPGTGPAPTATPTEVIEPEAQQGQDGSPANPPTLRESPAAPNTP